MSGDTSFPGGVDTAYGTEADYFSGNFDDIDGSGTDFSAWMRRIESASVNMQTYFPQTLGTSTGALINNSNATSTLLANTITIPADLMRAGSALKLSAHGYLIINNTTSTTVKLTPKLGSTTAVNIATAPASGAWTLSATAHLWELDLTIVTHTIGATADVRTFGSWRITQTTSSDMDGSLGAAFSFAGGGSCVVDTTADLAIDLQGQMSVASASNSFAGSYCVVTHIPSVN